MFTVVDANMVPIRDANGCALEALTLDEAFAYLARYPAGRVQDTDSGAVIEAAPPESRDVIGVTLDFEADC